MESEKYPLNIKIVSDILCPWCFVGRGKLGEAMKLAKGFVFSIEWEPYLLRPNLPKQGVRKPPHRKIPDEIKQLGASSGIVFSDKATVYPNTILGHCMLEFAKEYGLQDQIALALFRAYFTDGIDVGMVDNLIEIGVQNGLPKEALVIYLRDPESSRKVVKKATEYKEKYEMFGVPNWLFNERRVFSGAQDPESYVRYFERIKKLETRSTM